MTSTRKDQAGLHSLREAFRLQRDLFLLLPGEVDEVIVFCTNQERNGSLIEAATLSIPFFDTVQGRLASEVEHEEDRYCVVADEGEHVDEFALPA